MIELQASAFLNFRTRCGSGQGGNRFCYGGVMGESVQVPAHGAGESLSHVSLKPNHKKIE